MAWKRCTTASNKATSLLTSCWSRVQWIWFFELSLGLGVEVEDSKKCVYDISDYYIYRFFCVGETTSLSQRWILTNDLHHSNLIQINALFDVARKKNSTPSCTMTSGPRSNASGELVQITPKPSSTGGQTACDMEKVSESDLGASYVSPSPESARRLRTRSSVLNIYFLSWVMSLAKCELSEYVSIGNGFDWSALIKNKSTGKSDRSRTLNSPVVTFFLRIPTSRMQ